MTQTWSLEVGGRRGRRAGGEVAGRRHHHGAQRRPDRNRHHVELDALAEPDAGVEAARHEVHQPVVHHHLDRDVGMIDQELRQAGREDRARGIGEGGEAERARRRVAPVGERRDPALHRVERRAKRGQQPLARRRRRDAARRAREKADAEPGLELAHGVAERRGRQAELGGPRG